MWTPASTGAAFLLSLGLFENLLILGLFLRSARHGLRPPSKKLRPSKIMKNPSTPRARETLNRGGGNGGGFNGSSGNGKKPPLANPSVAPRRRRKPRFNFFPGIDLSVVGLATAQVGLCSTVLFTLVLSNGRMAPDTRLCDQQAFFVAWLEVAVLAYSCLLATMRHKFIVRQQETRTRHFVVHSALIWGGTAAFAYLGTRKAANVPGTSGIVCYPFGSLATLSETSFVWVWTVFIFVMTPLVVGLYLSVYRASRRATANASSMHLFTGPCCSESVFIFVMTPLVVGLYLSVYRASRRATANASSVHPSIARHTRLMALTATLAVLVPLCAVPLAVEFTQVLRSVGGNGGNGGNEGSGGNEDVGGGDVSASFDTAVAYLWMADALISPIAYMLVMPRYKEGILDILSVLCCCCRERVHGLRSPSLRHLDTSATSGSSAAAHDEFVLRMSARNTSERTSTVRSHRPLRSQVSDLDVESGFSSCVHSDEELHLEHSDEGSIVLELPAKARGGGSRPVPPFSSLTKSTKKRTFSNLARVPTLSDALASQDLNGGDVHQTSGLELKTGAGEAADVAEASSGGASLVSQTKTLQIPSEAPLSTQCSEFSVSSSSNSEECDVQRRLGLGGRQQLSEGDSARDLLPLASVRRVAPSEESESSSRSSVRPSHAHADSSSGTASNAASSSQDESASATGGNTPLAHAAKRFPAAVATVPPSSRSRLASLSPTSTLSLTRDRPATSALGRDRERSNGAGASAVKKPNKVNNRMSFSYGSRSQSSNIAEIEVPNYVEIEVEVTTSSMSSSKKGRGRSPRVRSRSRAKSSAAAAARGKGGKLAAGSRSPPAPPVVSPRIDLQLHRPVPPSRSVTAYASLPRSDSSRSSTPQPKVAKPASGSSGSGSGIVRVRSRSPSPRRPVSPMSAMSASVMVAADSGGGTPAAPQHTSTLVGGMTSL